MIASPLRPRQRQELGIAAAGQLAHQGTPYGASLSFAPRTHLWPLSDPPSRQPRSSALTLKVGLADFVRITLANSSASILSCLAGCSSRATSCSPPSSAQCSASQSPLPTRPDSNQPPDGFESNRGQPHSCQGHTGASVISATRRSRIPAESTLAESGRAFPASGSPEAMFAEGWQLRSQRLRISKVLSAEPERAVVDAQPNRARRNERKPGW